MVSPLCHSANRDRALCSLSARDTRRTVGEAWRKFSRYRVYAPATGLRQGIKFGAAIDNCHSPVPKALANLIASGYPTLIFYGIMQQGSDHFIFISQLPVPKLPHSTSERCKGFLLCGSDGMQTGTPVLLQIERLILLHSFLVALLLVKLDSVSTSLAMLCRIPRAARLHH